MKSSHCIKITLAFLAGIITLLTPLYSTPSSETKATSRPLVIYSHGFGGNRLRVFLVTKGYDHLINYLYGEPKETYRVKHYLFDPQLHHIVSFNYPDVYLDFGIRGSIPNLQNANIAQQADIGHLAKILSRYQEQTHNGVIGYGYSRGAATWLTTLGTGNAPYMPNVLIVEAPFATTHNTSLFAFIKSSLQSLAELFAFDQTTTDHLLKRIVGSFFQQHDVGGTQPINVVANIPHDLPILLVHAQDDAVIPIDDSRKLYLELVKSGHKHVYLLELPEGGHGLCLWGPYGELYRNVVHTFYQKYNLPYNPDFAQGISLENYQPTEQDIENKFQQPLCEPPKVTTTSYKVSFSASI